MSTRPEPVPRADRTGVAGGNGVKLQGSRLGIWLRRLFGLVILAFAIYLVHRLVSAVGWEEVRERLAEASLPAVAVAAVLLALQLALWSFRQWIGMRRIISTPPAWAVFLSLVSTAAANYMIPFARLVGGLLRARYLSRASRPHSPKRVYYGTVLFDQTAHLAVMGGFTLVGLVIGAALLDRPAVGVGVALALALGVVGVIAWVRHRAGGDGGVGASFIRFLERRAERKKGVAGTFFAGSEMAAKIYFRLLANGWLWRRSIVIGLGVFGAVAAAQWTVFYALGDPVDPLLVITTLAIGMTAGVLLGTPGGLGTTEATMIALYGALGVDPVGAASAVLLFRGLQFAVVLGLGLPGMLVLELYGMANRRREGTGQGPGPDPGQGPPPREVAEETVEEAKATG